MNPKTIFAAFARIVLVTSGATLLLFGSVLASCNTAAWTSATGTAAQAVEAAKFEENCGLRLDLDETAGWVEDGNPGTLGDVIEYVARFYVYLNDAQVPNGETLTLFNALDAGSNELFGLELKGSNEGMLFQIYANDSQSRKDATAPAPPGWRAVSLHWTAGASNGSLSLSMEKNVGAALGVVQTLSGLDNATQVVDSVQLGVVGGNSAGINGIIDMDSFTSRRTGSAVLVSKSCSSGVVDNITFLPGTTNCGDASSGLTFGSRVTFDPGATVNVTALTVALGPRTLIPGGAVLSIQL